METLPQAPSRTRLACANCREIDTEPELAGARGPARHWPLVRCRRCGLVFQERMPALEDLEAGQALAYGAPQRRFAGPVEAGVRLARGARVRLASRLTPPGGRILDVGCGRGLFLRMMQERGFRVRGTELSAETAANAGPGIPIDVGEIQPGRYPEGAFDLVSIWHVLEHLRFPDRALAACHTALVPGGRLLVAVPNYASLQARLGGEHWFHLDLPRHLFHFTPATLTRLLESRGFEVERLRTGQWEMDPFGLLQTVLNRMGLRPNALYDTLRNQPEVKRDLSLAARLALVALLPLGLALSAPASALFRVLGRAGSLVVVARKPATGRSAA